MFYGCIRVLQQLQICSVRPSFFSSFLPASSGLRSFFPFCFLPSFFQEARTTASGHHKKKGSNEKERKPSPPENTRSWNQGYWTRPAVTPNEPLSKFPVSRLIAPIIGNLYSPLYNPPLRSSDYGSDEHILLSTTHQPSGRAALYAVQLLEL